MKKIISLILITSLLAVSLGVYAAEPNEKSTYTYNEMLNQYLKDSKEVERIDTQHAIDKKNYDDNYDRLQNAETRLEIAKLSMDNIGAMKDQLWEDYSKEKKYSYKKKDRYFAYVRKGSEYYGNKLGYENGVKTEMDSYPHYILLKIKLENFEQTKKIAKLQAQHNFESEAYNYYIAKKEKALLEENKVLKEEELKTLKEKLKLGLTTSIKVSELEALVYSIKKQEVEVQNNIDKGYETLKRLLNIEGTNPEFDIKVTEPTPMTLLPYESYKSIYKKNNLDQKLLDAQKDIYKVYREKIDIAYDEDDYEYKVKSLETKKNELKLDANLRTMDIGISRLYTEHKKIKTDFELAKMDKKIADKEFEIMTEKFKCGKISDLQYKQAQYKYKKQQLTYEKAVVTYNAGVNRYKQCLLGSK